MYGNIGGNENMEKWVNKGWKNETRKIRDIPNEIIIWSVNDLF